LFARLRRFTGAHGQPLLLAVLLLMRVNLGKRQAALDQLFLAYED